MISQMMCTIVLTSYSGVLDSDQSHRTDRWKPSAGWNIKNVSMISPFYTEHRITHPRLIHHVTPSAEASKYSTLNSDIQPYSQFQDYNPLSILGSFNIHGRAESVRDSIGESTRTLKVPLYTSEVDGFLVPPPQNSFRDVVKSYATNSNGYTLDTTPTPQLSYTSEGYKSTLNILNHSLLSEFLNSKVTQSSQQAFGRDFQFQNKPKLSNEHAKPEVDLIIPKNQFHSNTQTPLINDHIESRRNYSLSSHSPFSNDANDRNIVNTLIRSNIHEPKLSTESSLRNKDITINVQDVSNPINSALSVEIEKTPSKCDKIEPIRVNGDTRNINHTRQHTETLRKTLNKILPTYTQWDVETPESISLRHFNEKQLVLQKKLMERDKLQLQLERQHRNKITQRPDSNLLQVRGNGSNVDLRKPLGIDDTSSAQVSNKSITVIGHNNEKNNFRLANNNILSNISNSQNNDTSKIVRFHYSKNQYEHGNSNHSELNANISKNSLIDHKNSTNSFNNKSSGIHNTNLTQARDGLINVDDLQNPSVSIASTTLNFPNKKRNNPASARKFSNVKIVTTAAPSTTKSEVQNKFREKTFKTLEKINSTITHCRDSTSDNCVSAKNTSILLPAGNNSRLSSIDKTISLDAEKLMRKTITRATVSNKNDYIRSNISTINTTFTGIVHNISSLEKLSQIPALGNSSTLVNSSMSSAIDKNIPKYSIEKNNDGNYVSSLEQLFNITEIDSINKSEMPEINLSNVTVDSLNTLRHEVTTRMPSINRFRPMKFRNNTRPRFSIKDYKNRRDFKNHLAWIAPTLNTSHSQEKPRTSSPIINKPAYLSKNHGKYTNFTRFMSDKFARPIHSDNASHNKTEKPVSNFSTIYKNSLINDTSNNSSKNKISGNFRRKSSLHSSFRSRLSVLKRKNTSISVLHKMNSTNQVRLPSKSNNADLNQRLHLTNSSIKLELDLLPSSVNKSVASLKVLDNVSKNANDSVTSQYLEKVNKSSVDNFQSIVSDNKNFEATTINILDNEDLKDDMDIFAEISQNVADLTSSGSALDIVSETLHIPKSEVGKKSIKIHSEELSLPIETFFKALRQ